MISFEIWSFPGGPRGEPYSSKSGETVFLRAKVFVILDIGHHLTSNPMDIESEDEQSDFSTIENCYELISSL